MKVKREMPLAEALDEIATVVQGLKGDGSAKVNGHEIGLDDRVTLEIESESGKKNAELDFDIKWAKSKAKKGGGRRTLLALALTGAAVGAGAYVMARRRKSAGDELEDEM